MTGVRILDLFSGMGGLSLGFALALDAEILGLDIDRYAVMTYNYNLNRFGARAEVQDVLAWEPCGEWDIVMGGVPCQPFSLANTKKRGRNHPLYPTLPRFFDIVLELDPKAFLMENVRGLVTRTHRHLLEEQLERVGVRYRVRWQVLNSSFYGVPQRRERLFVLGIRRDLDPEPSFPLETHSKVPQVTLDGRVLHKWVTVREAIGDLLAIPPCVVGRKKGKVGGMSITEHNINPKKLFYSKEQIERVLKFRRGKLDDLDEPARTVKVDGRGGDKTNDAILVPLIAEHVVNSVKIGIANPKGFGDASKVPNRLDLPAKTVMKGGGRGGAIPPLVELPTEHDIQGYIDPEKQFRRSWIRRHPIIDKEEASPTIVGHIHKNLSRSELAVRDCVGYRRLTVRECLRLQSFPDWWSFPDKVSISRKYKLIGEAVCPILAYRLAIHIGKLMGWKVKEPPKYEEWQLPYFYRAFADYFSEVSKQSDKPTKDEASNG